MPGASIPSSSSSFLSDLSALSSHLTPTTALYILLRRADSLSSPEKSLVAVTYVPNAAPVRQKMLFASTRLTLTRELGGEHFAESVFCTEASELSAEGWERHVKHTETENPLTAEEESLKQIKEAEASESRGTRGQGLAGAGTLKLRADEGCGEALRRLGEGGGGENVVVLRMDPATETLKLVQSTSTTPSSLSTLFSDTEPTFAFYNFSPSPSSSTSSGSGIIFISTCPSRTKVRERMLYAASRGNVLLLAQQEGGLKVVKKMEATNREEVSEEAVREEFREEEKVVKEGFSKPKRPGRR